MSSYEHPSPYEDAETPLRRALKERRLFAGIAVACVAGLAFGFVMKPRLSDETPKQVNRRVVEIPTEPGYGIDIVVAPRPAQAPLPVSTTPLPAPVYDRPDFPVARPALPRVIERPVAVEAPPPVRRVASTERPSFNCRYARTVSEQMVCGDPGLADADRRMARAYSRAVRSGIPHQVLRRQQDVWLDAREQAAHDHPDAVAEVYEARIAELRDMARY